MISKQQYQSAVRGENYPVVFGVINQDNFTVHSARGLRNQSHGDFPAFRSLIRDNISWRYVPSTEFIYWWEVPTAQEDQARQHLLDNDDIIKDLFTDLLKKGAQIINREETVTDNAIEEYWNEG
jgi:ketosteroid isomerase-like protein